MERCSPRDELSNELGLHLDGDELIADLVSAGHPSLLSLGSFTVGTRVRPREPG